MNSEESTKRFRSMEFFLLAVVGKCGLNSLYSLREEAGLQPGAIGSAIRELERLNLISRTEPGPRMRREIQLTETGLAFLESAWAQCQRDFPEIESVLRASMVALIMAGPDEAGRYLRGVAQGRTRQAREAAARAAFLEPPRVQGLDDYAWVRSAAESRRRESEAETLLRISERMLARDKSEPAYSPTDISYKHQKGEVS